MNPVFVWWGFLSVVSVLNIGLWAWTGKALEARREALGPDGYALRRRLWLLAAVFVFGCAFRSFLPRADVQRICLVDTWLSCVLLGRAVATAAELSYMASWALVLREVASKHGARWAARASYLVVPAIAFAETCSWTAVVTTNYLGNVIEESTWGLTGLLLTVSAASLWPRLSGTARRWLVPGLVLGVCYVAFMANVDVPMYLSRWHADTAAGRTYLDFGAGIHDLATRWRVTYDPAEWWTEMPWMGLYFSVAVWSSIALVWLRPIQAQGRLEVPDELGGAVG